MCPTFNSGSPRPSVDSVIAWVWPRRIKLPIPSQLVAVKPLRCSFRLPRSPQGKIDSPQSSTRKRSSGPSTTTSLRPSPSTSPAVTRLASIDRSALETSANAPAPD